MISNRLVIEHHEVTLLYEIVAVTSRYCHSHEIAKLDINATTIEILVKVDIINPNFDHTCSFHMASL